MTNADSVRLIVDLIPEEQVQAWDECVAWMPMDSVIEEIGLYHFDHRYPEPGALLSGRLGYPTGAKRHIVIAADGEVIIDCVECAC